MNDYGDICYKANSARELGIIAEEKKRKEDIENQKRQAIFDTAVETKEQNYILLQQLTELKKQNNQLKDSNQTLSENYQTLKSMYDNLKVEIEQSRLDVKRGNFRTWFMFVVATVIAILGIVF